MTHFPTAKTPPQLIPGDLRAQESLDGRQINVRFPKERSAKQEKETSFLKHLEMGNEASKNETPGQPTASPRNAESRRDNTKARQPGTTTPTPSSKRNDLEAGGRPERGSRHNSTAKSRTTHAETSSDTAAKPFSSEPRELQRARGSRDTENTLSEDGSSDQSFGTPPPTSPSAGIPRELERLHSVDTANLNANLLTEEISNSSALEAVIAQSPVLSLITGHLENLEPAVILNTLNKSPLLADILSAPDVSHVFSKQMPLSDALAELGLESSDILHSGHLDSANGPTITLAQTLSTLGLDLGAVLRAAQSLKDMVAAEGIRPILLLAHKQKSEKQAEEAAMQMGNVQQNPSLLVPTHDGTQTSNIKNLNIENSVKEKGSNKLETLNTAIVHQKSAFIGSNSGKLLSELSSLPEKETITETPTTSPNGKTEPGLLFTTEQTPHKSEQPTPELTNILELQLKTKDSQNLMPRPTAKLVVEDPFSQIETRWDSNSVQAIELPRSEEMIENDNSAPALTHPSELTQDMSREIPQATQNSRTDTDLIAPRATFASSQDESLFITREPKDEQAPSDQSPNDQDQGQTNLTSPHNGLSSSPVSSGSLEKSTFTLASPSIISQEHQEAVQKIFDNSSMLLKEGGGSIRVDLGTENLGPIELALEIKDSKVDLRIIAQSSQARDLIAQELSNLKNSLMRNNLDLQRVEVGLSSGFGWSQSSGQQSQNDPSWNWNEQGILSNARSIREKTGYRSILNVSQDTALALHNGKIQVRI